MRLFYCLLISLAPPMAWAGALENYIARPDTNYAWKKLEQTNKQGFVQTHLRLTSQKWRESVWKHDIQIVKPEKLRHNGIAFLFITGDGTGTTQLPLLRVMAESAGAYAAVVAKVPNQPLYDGRSEDALIAYTLDQYIRTGDETWPLLFPMTKSVVRAMDAISEFAQSETGAKVEKFVVSGASKRGWTTYLTAAADPRVVGMAPMVIDMLNMKAQVDWAEKVYGKQSAQIQDYTDYNLIARIDQPPMQRLRSWIDPYSYRQRYNMPKLLLLGTNDPYWTVDSLRHYWSDLPGPKLVFQTPNAGHNLNGGEEMTPTLAQFFEMIADNHSLPKVEWQFHEKPKAGVTVNFDKPLKSVRLWTATSSDRDFRNEKWLSQEIRTEAGARTLTATVDQPDKGFRAFMVEAVFTGENGREYKVSTEAPVTPDVDH